MDNVEKKEPVPDRDIHDFFNGIFDDDNDSQVKGESPVEKLIKYEPPYDQPCTDDFDDLRNFGYGGYGDMLHMNVYDISDVRMLVNYYAFLNTDSCKVSYERARRDYRLSFFNATEALLSTVVGSKLCEKIPVHVGSSGLEASASSVARILIDNSYDRGNNRTNHDFVRDEINLLVDDLRFYFYAHIDYLRLKEDSK